MSVTALAARTGRDAQSSASGRAAPTLRRSASPLPALSTSVAPALTVTLAIPLNSEALTPQAHRLLDAVRELVELGQGTVSMAPATEPAPRGDLGVQRPLESRAAHTLAADATGLQKAHPTDVQLLAASRQVLVGGNARPMTRLEFDLLLFLADNPRRVFSRTQLLSAVWGYEHTGERTVDVHVRRLRVKMGGYLPLITTVYGVGYRLADDAHVSVVADA